MRKSLSAVAAAVMLILMGIAAPAAAQPSEEPKITFSFVEKCVSVVVQIRVVGGTDESFSLTVGKKGDRQTTVSFIGETDYPVVVQQGETVQVQVFRYLTPITPLTEHVRQTPAKCVLTYTEVVSQPLCTPGSMVVGLDNDKGPTSAFSLFRGSELIVRDIVLDTFQDRHFVVDGLTGGNTTVYVKYGPDFEDYGLARLSPAQNCENASAVKFTDRCDGTRLEFSPANPDMSVRVYPFIGTFRSTPAGGPVADVSAEPGELVVAYSSITVGGGEFAVEKETYHAAHVHQRPANCSGGGGGGLPVTGDRTPLFVSAGAVLLTAGAIALILGRRRRYRA